MPSRTAFQIGVDTAFFKIAISWEGTTALFRRNGELVIDVSNVVRLSEEWRESPQTEQTILFLRLFRADGSVCSLFLDNDNVQSNAREVSPDLERLDDVFPWLLDQDFVHRQGDVGVYACAQVPLLATLVSEEHVLDMFEPVLSRRHTFDPLSSCELFVGNNSYYVRVNKPVRLIHPEHRSIPLAIGLYEIRGARGTALPNYIGLRDNERAALEG
jgi:hypothetical protein